MHSRLRYITSFCGIIDLISIIPFTVPHFLEKGSSHADMLGFAPIFLIFKLIKYSKAFNFMIGVFRSVKAKWVAIFIVACTTVGYGTIYPITTVGKILASRIALIGSHA